MPRQFGRYVITGGLSFLADLTVLIVLHGWLQVNITVATVAAFLVALLTNFLLNQRWTFTASTRETLGDMIRFGLLVAANLLVTSILMTVLTDQGFSYLLVKVGTTALLTLTNFPLMRFWVFRATPAAP